MPNRKGIDIVAVYLNEIGKIKLLDREEEIAVAKRIEKGKKAKKKLDENVLLSDNQKVKLITKINDGEEACQILVKANLRLVISIAIKDTTTSFNSVLSWLDLIQEASIMLLTVAEKFEWKKGNKFSTYATCCIRRFIKKILGKQTRTIATPPYIWRRISKYRAAKERLSKTLNRPPRLQEIASQMGIKIIETANIKEAIINTESIINMVSLDSIVEEGFENFPHYSFEIDERLIRMRILKEAISRLTQEEQEVLAMRLNLENDTPHTLDAIARKLGKRVEAIKQIQAKALEKLRNDEKVRQLE